MSSFASLCGVVVANAPSYKSELACHSMLSRVRRAWERAGCYGSNKDLMIDALNAIKDRLFYLSWVRVNGVESW